MSSGYGTLITCDPGSIADWTITAIIPRCVTAKGNTVARNAGSALFQPVVRTLRHLGSSMTCGNGSNQSMRAFLCC